MSGPDAVPSFETAGYALDQRGAPTDDVFDLLVVSAEAAVRVLLDELLPMPMQWRQFERLMSAGITGVLPEQPDAPWAAAILLSNPELLDRPCLNADLREALVELVEQSIGDVLEEDLLQHAWDRGIEVLDLPRRLQDGAQ